MPEIAKEAQFTVSATGEMSGRQLSGVFTVKTRLSFDDQLMRDQKRRELIGPFKGDVSERAQNAADIISELFVRVTKAPSWWVESRGGRDLEDDDILGAVYAKAMETVVEANKPLKTEAEKAAADLKTEAAAPPAK